MRKIRFLPAMLIAVALALNSIGCTNGQPTAQTAQAVNTAFAVADASLALYEQQATDAAAALDAATAKLKASPNDAALQDAWTKRQRAYDQVISAATQFRTYLTLTKALTPLLVSPPQVIALPVDAPK